MTPSFDSPIVAVQRTAAVLPSLQEAALTLMRGRKSSPVSVYLGLIDAVHAADLRAEAALSFRTRFNGYYGVRRNAAWREAFYGAFEDMKASDRSAPDLFDAGLRALHQRTGRVEASFVSKAVATLHPASPVIDKVLRDRFTNLTVAPQFGNGLEAALIYHRWLAEVMTLLAKTSQAQAWFGIYDDSFAGIPGAAGIHPVKKLDFLIWGGRAVGSA